jgi:hypothetical protein
VAPNTAIARRLLTAALVLALLSGARPARADDAIDPSLIPDGTYPAHVDRVITAQRIEVTMQGTLRVFLTAARPSVNFSDKIKASDDIAVTLAEGKVTGFSKK